MWVALNWASLLTDFVACQFALMWSAAAAGRLSWSRPRQRFRSVSLLQRRQPQRLESLGAASPTSPLFTRCHCVCIRPTAKPSTNQPRWRYSSETPDQKCLCLPSQGWMFDVWFPGSHPTFAHKDSPSFTDEQEFPCFKSCLCGQQTTIEAVCCDLTLLTLRISLNSFIRVKGEGFTF